MKLADAIQTTTEVDGTTYTLDHAVAAFAVVYTYRSRQRGTYTYIEYYRDRDWAEVTAEESIEIAAEESSITGEDLDQLLDEKDQLLACQLVRF